MRVLKTILALVAITCAPVRATGEEVLVLDEIVSEALRRNPEVQAAQKRYEASRQKPRQEGSLPDPLFSVGYNSSGSPRPFAGIGREPTSNAGFSVSQEFPYPGKRALRSQIASKEADAEFQSFQAVQLSIISRVTQAYHRLHHAYAAIDILERNRDLFEQLLRITETRYSVGRAAQQDIFKAQTQVSIVETKLAQVQRDRRSREAEINSLLNRPPGTPVAKPDDTLPPQQLSMTLDELFQLAQGRAPALVREQKLIERAETAVSLARKDYLPDYTLTGGYYNMGGMPDMYVFRADIKLPLYFARKQRAAVTEKAQVLAESRRGYEAADQSLHLRLSEDYYAAETSARLMELYSRTIIPQASLALESSLTSYETGSVDFLSVLTNAVAVQEYEMNYHEEIETLQLALSRLAEMSGVRDTGK
jgi:outer membrane protein, heavy metal efflux system